MNIEKLKDTFQTTDLASKKKDDKVAVDPLAFETEKGIIEEDDDQRWRFIPQHIPRSVAERSPHL